FFHGFSLLATDVTAATARDAVVREGEARGQAVRSLSADLSEAQRATDRSTRDSVGELSQLAAKVAQLNARITGGGSTGPDIDALRDERNVATQRMAELADVTVLNRSDGAVDVTVATGYAMVVGSSSYEMTITPQPPSGFVQLSLADHDVTTRLTGGRIGGVIEIGRAPGREGTTGAGGG